MYFCEKVVQENKNKNLRDPMEVYTFLIFRLLG